MTRAGTSDAAPIRTAASQPRMSHAATRIATQRSLVVQADWRGIFFRVGTRRDGRLCQMLVRTGVGSRQSMKGAAMAWVQALNPAITRASSSYTGCSGDVMVLGATIVSIETLHRSYAPSIGGTHDVHRLH